MLWLHGGLEQTAAADLQTALICKGGGRRPPPASPHPPLSLPAGVVSSCIAAWLITPASLGPVSLHLYLRVQRVLDGGNGGWVGVFFGVTSGRADLLRAAVTLHHPTLHLGQTRHLATGARVRCS